MKQQVCHFPLYDLKNISIEYDGMDLEMLREVVPMLRQQLEKSMLDRNYVQLERVHKCFCWVCNRNVGCYSTIL